MASGARSGGASGGGVGGVGEGGKGGNKGGGRDGGRSGDGGDRGPRDGGGKADWKSSVYTSTGTFDDTLVMPSRAYAGGRAGGRSTAELIADRSDDIMSLSPSRAKGKGKEGAKGRKGKKARGLALPTGGGGSIGVDNVWGDEAASPLDGFDYAGNPLAMDRTDSVDHNSMPARTPPTREGVPEDLDAMGRPLGALGGARRGGEYDAALRDLSPGLAKIKVEGGAGGSGSGVKGSGQGGAAGGGGGGSWFSCGGIGRSPGAVGGMPGGPKGSGGGGGELDMLPSDDQVRLSAYLL
jgi:hypothetical protein